MAAALAPLDEYGRSCQGACRTRRRVERMGMLDMWVPLSHLTTNAGGPPGAMASAIHNASTFHTLLKFGWFLLCLMPRPRSLVATPPGDASHHTTLVWLNRHISFQEKQIYKKVQGIPFRAFDKTRYHRHDPYMWYSFLISFFLGTYIVLAICP